MIIPDPAIKHEYCVVFKKPGLETQAPPFTERCLRAPEVGNDGNRRRA